MADFISSYPGVDKDRLGVLGICGGGGYTLNAAKSDKRFKAVATLSMFNSGEVRRNGYMNSQLDTIQERLKEASDAREKKYLQEIFHILEILILMRLQMKVLVKFLQIFIVKEWFIMGKHIDIQMLHLSIQQVA